MDHRQLVCENDLEYLLNDVEDLSGVSLNKLDCVEKLFDLHIDVFSLKENTTEDKKKRKQNTCAAVVQTSSRRSEGR